MSDKKIDLILNKLESMETRFLGMDKRFEGVDKRFDRNEEMISVLIQIVGTTHLKVEDLQTDVSILLDNRINFINPKPC